MATTRDIIDIHNHVLYGVDDGASTIEESVDLVLALEKLGVKGIVLTTHYIVNSKFDKTVLEREERLEKLKDKVKDIDFYLGNEVYIFDDILKYQKEKKLTTINNTRYMLVELPMHYISQDIFFSLSKLIKNGIVPIIAHPERYEFIKEDRSLIDEFINYGCLFQCNVGSIVNMYGNRAKTIFKYMLKNGYVSFLGSDIHSLRQVALINKGYDKIKKMVGEKEFRRLTYDNPLKVIQNEEIDR